jgi:Tol biopolymer transport system component
MRLLTIILTLAAVIPSGAQVNPSHVYLFKVQRLNDSAYQFTQPQLLTDFNPNGYNNHPAFFSNYELYLSSQLPGESQPEIFSLDLERKVKTKVTQTRDGEYSPFRMPDYYNFSAVRMEFYPEDTIQRLWQFPTDRLSNGKPIFKYFNNVGYYHWINSRQVALFLVDQPNQLVLADVDNDRTTAITSNPGRCFRLLPDGQLAFVQKTSYGDWKIMKHKPSEKEAEPVTIIETLPGSEDFAILPDGTFLMGNDSKIFKFREGVDENWVQIADLRFYNIRNITRLAISPGGGSTFQLAIVGTTE